MKKRISSMVWGLAILTAGVILTLNALDVTNIDIFFDGWWSLFIIIPFAVGLLTEKDKTGNLIGLLIGVAILLANQNVFSFHMLWKFLVPVLVILLGLKIFAGAFKKDKGGVKVIVDVDSKDLPPNVALFSGVDIHPNNEVFNGTELVAIFGGVDCDLRDAIFERDCKIKAVAIFGGIDIKLPDNVKVVVNSTSVFGGTEDRKSQLNNAEDTVTVYIEAVSVFGGVDIK